MEMIIGKVLYMLVTGMTGVGLTFARRYNNSDKNAGIGVAIGTFTLIGIMWCVPIMTV